MTFPKHLLEQIKSKNVMLFLGAGASFGAQNNIAGEKIPNGQQLSDLIAEKFLGSEYKDKQLSTIAELAINESSLYDVQYYIYQLLNDFNPVDFHFKIAEFPWHTVFTTNYDLLIERVYERNKSKVQNLHPIVRNTPFNQLPKDEKTLLYYKLHGCLSVVNDATLPLILTVDQFIYHQAGRERMFARFLELVYDNPILFVGYNVSDPDIRYILAQVEKLSGAKPMSYIVSPMITEAEMRYWQSRRYTVFKMSFENFLNELDNEIVKKDRVLGSIKRNEDYKIFEKFQVNLDNIKITHGLKVFLDNDVEYINRNLQTTNTDPKSFYKGYFENWDPIIKNLDVKRVLTDALLFEVFLNDEKHTSDNVYLYLIEGNAGSGKSVLLKRVAYEAAIETGKVCIFLKRYSKISVDALFELYNYLKDRIYLFIDNASDSKNEIINLITKARKNNIPITIIAAERSNVWNTECEDLSNYLSDTYRLKYLTDKEINELLVLLEKHNCLGSLESKSDPERIQMLKEKSGRELLVAMYEATNGRPFEEIIIDEYRKIGDPAAQSLYLTVSILQRLGAEARAGLISRVHGISFTEFKDKLFKPLQYVVFDRKNPRIDDYVYITRHQQVAEFVFSHALTTPQERFDEYVRILQHLNLDFEADRIAYIAMTNAKQLIQLFRDPGMIRNYYDLAEQNVIDKNRLIQQRAIFEMTAPGGSYAVAERMLRSVSQSDTDDPLIQHSLAELILKKAEAAKYDNEFYSYIDDVINRCLKIIQNRKEIAGTHPYHTILKAIVLKLKKVIDTDDAGSIQRTLKDAEKYFSIASQVSPDDSFILETESAFNEIIDNKPNAKELLKKAFDSNKNSPFIAMRYANFLERESDVSSAILVISTCLGSNPHDKDLNFRLAQLLEKKNDNNLVDIIHHLRRSFTNGDSRYHAQFLYARALFINGDYENSKQLFSKLGRINTSPDIKNTPRSKVRSGGVVVEYTGDVSSIYYNHGWITRHKYGDSIYFRTAEVEESNKVLKFRKQVKFNIAFTYRGPIAVNIKDINKVS
ncbi:MAG TPA: SIR2 family protein [Flavipsychrobacter sp.]|nr:SIR2 family protein [Flavipsychrobacter sp.]